MHTVDGYGLSKLRSYICESQLIFRIRRQREDHSVRPCCNILHKLYILLTAEHGTTLAYMFLGGMSLRYSLSQWDSTRIERYLQPKCLTIYDMHGRVRRSDVVIHYVDLFHLPQLRSQYICTLAST